MYRCNYVSTARCADVSIYRSLQNNVCRSSSSVRNRGRCFTVTWEEHPSGLGLKQRGIFYGLGVSRTSREKRFSWQRVNHFMIRKLWHEKITWRKLSPTISHWVGNGIGIQNSSAKTFLLPQEYVALIEAGHKNHCKDEFNTQNPRANIWVMKPVASSRGRGILLFKYLNQLIMVRMLRSSDM